MKFIFCWLIILLPCFNNVWAQDAINTDRPDQSDGTHLVETNHFQIETGVQYSKTDELTSSFDNITLLRYGVSKKFEVRLLNQYAVVRNDIVTSGLRPVAVSFKNQLCDQHGLLPKLTLVSYCRLPVTKNKANPGHHFGYTFTLAGRHELSSKVKLYSNFGVTQDQESTSINYQAALELSYNITEKISTYTEYFGNFAPHTSAANGLDAGLFYTVKNNVAVDVALGSPTLKLNLARFISFGISTRLPN